MHTSTVRQKNEIEQLLTRIVARLVATYHPECIILFGSYASGQYDADSDIDLLIIKATDEPPLERRVQVRRLLSDPHRHVPVSPLVVTPAELRHRLSQGDPFFLHILRHGKTLYVRE